jgi:cholesterol transport system auxiliary component
MTMTTRRTVLAGLSLVSLGGCSAVSALSGAARELDAYTLSPVTVDGQPAGGRAHLVVAEASTIGELSTDRILIKPTRLQAQYLPDGRWSEPAPVLVQSLLLGSVRNRGGFRLVSRDGAGLLPDYTLLTDLNAFEAAPGGAGEAPFVVTVGWTLTLIREADRQIVGTLRVIHRAGSPSDDTGPIVSAFDVATQAALAESVAWLGRRA